MHFARRSLFTGALVALSLLASLLSPASSLAQDDSLLMSFQGYLTDDAGDPITDTVSVTFTLYDPRGIPVWSETHLDVPVIAGQWVATLGSHSLIPDIRFNGDDRADGFSLGIIVGADDEMTPRIPLTSVPGAAVARYLVGDVTTEPGMLLVKSPAGDSAIVLSSDAAKTGLSVRGTNGVGYLGHIELTVTGDEASGVFGNAEPFAMAGDFEITSNADEAGLLMNHGAGDDSLGIEFKASSEANLIRLHPPDPCDSPPCSAATTITAGDQEVDFDIHITVPPDDVVTPISIRTSLEDQSSHLRVSGPAAGSPPQVEMIATTAACTLTVQGSDPTGGSNNPLIVMTADATSAFVGIGTDSAAEALTVMGNGWFSGDVFTFTDTKAKRDIVPIDDALEMVARMNGYYYDFRADEYPGLQLPRDRQIGFLAHEVKEVVPEAVGENEYGLTGVSYSRLTALLVEAVKELKAENEELRARIVRLEEGR
jgi:hypothetical protein